jgi:hypothetical protein
MFASPEVNFLPANAHRSWWHHHFTPSEQSLRFASILIKHRPTLRQWESICLQMLCRVVQQRLLLMFVIPITTDQMDKLIVSGIVLTAQPLRLDGRLRSSCVLTSRRLPDGPERHVLFLLRSVG